MFKWYMTENFSLKVLRIVVLVYGFLLYILYQKVDIFNQMTNIQNVKCICFSFHGDFSLYRTEL